MQIKIIILELARDTGKKPASATPASMEELFTDIKRLLQYEAIGMDFDKIYFWPYLALKPKFGQQLGGHTRQF